MTDPMTTQACDSVIDLAHRSTIRKRRLVMQSKGITPDNARALTNAGYRIVGWYDTAHHRISRIAAPGSAGPR